MSRASTYTDQVAEAICERIANGETLRAICRDEGMPAWRTVYLWVQEREEFAARLARARDLGEDALAQQCLEIADTPVEGKRVEISEDGKRVVTEDALGHRKLQIETRLKLLKCWNPKKYGDRVGITDGEGGPLRVVVQKLTDGDA